MRPRSTRRRILQMLLLWTMLAAKGWASDGAKESLGKKKPASSGHFKTSNWPWERSRRRVQGSTGGGEVGSWGGERKGEGLGVHRTVWTVWTLWAHHRRAHPLQNSSWVWGANTRQPLTSSWGVRGGDHEGLCWTHLVLLLLRENMTAKKSTV